MENPSSPPENVPDTSDAGGDTDRNSRHPIPLPCQRVSKVLPIAPAYVEAARPPIPAQRPLARQVHDLAVSVGILLSASSPARR
jgi:hypothetical protein